MLLLSSAHLRMITPAHHTQHSGSLQGGYYSARRYMGLCVSACSGCIPIGAGGPSTVPLHTCISYCPLATLGASKSAEPRP